MVPLEPCGPVRSKAVFNARAKEPPTLVVGSTGGKRADTGYRRRQGCAVGRQGAAGMAVEQPVVCRPAEACRKGGDPIDLCAGSNDSSADDRRRVRLEIRSIEHPFDADNKLRRELPIVADLTAGDKTGTIIVEARIEEIIGQC